MGLSRALLAPVLEHRALESSVTRVRDRRLEAFCCKIIHIFLCSGPSNACLVAGQREPLSGTSGNAGLALSGLRHAEPADLHLWEAQTGQLGAGKGFLRQVPRT